MRAEKQFDGPTKKCTRNNAALSKTQVLERILSVHYHEYIGNVITNTMHFINTRCIIAALGGAMVRGVVIGGGP